MDTIYSRKRIKINKLYNKNAKKLFSIFVVVLIMVSTFYTIFSSLNPIFEELCITKARQTGTYIMNEAAHKILNNFDYSQILTIEKFENNNILKTDVVTINKIASDIVLEAEEKFSNLEKETIKIPIGALTGNKYLSGMGPNINIKVIPTGSISTEIKNEFEAKGINQTIYRIYLELKCSANIVTNYKTIEDELTSQVLLVETVVVGDVPESYYNLEGLNKENTIDLVK